MAGPESPINTLLSTAPSVNLLQTLLDIYRVPWSVLKAILKNGFTFVIQTIIYLVAFESNANSDWLKHTL